MLGQCSMTQITRFYSPFSVSFILHPLRDDCTSSLSSILLDWLGGLFNATRDFTQDNISEGEVNCAKSDDAAPAATHAMQTELSRVAHKLKKKKWFRSLETATLLRTIWLSSGERAPWLKEYN